MAQFSKLPIKRSKLFLGAVISCICVFTVMRQVNLQELRASLKLIDWTSILLGLVSLSISYLIRIFRWSFTLTKMNAVASFRQCVTPFLGSIALNNLLPFRIGDGVRALIYPKKMNIRTSLGVSSLLVEKILDLCVLAIFLSLGIHALDKREVPDYVSVTLYSLIFTCVVFIIIFFFIQKKSIVSRLQNREGRDSRSISRLIRSGLNAVEDTKLLFNSNTFFIITTMSFAIWIFESGLFFFILQGFGLSPTPAVAIFVSSVVTISTTVPSLPGYIGTFHAAAFLSITILGGSEVIGLSFALIAHLMLWLPTTVIGLIAIGSDYDLFKRVNREVATIKLELKNRNL